MTIFGYDPARITLLRTRTIEACSELRRIRCSDPAAEHTMRVIRLMHQNLEDAWLPLIEAIHTSTAMIAWRRAAGLVDGTVERAVGRLVEQFDASGGWIATSGFDHVGDDHLIDLLDGALSDLLDAMDGHGDLSARWQRVEVLLGEVERRDMPDALRSAADRGDLARGFLDRHGIEAVSRLLDVVERAGQLLDRSLVGGVSGQNLSTTSLGMSLAGVLGPLLAHDDRVLHLIVARSTRGPHLARMIATAPEHFDLDSVAAVTRELVLHGGGRGQWERRPRVNDLSGETSTLLALMARSPDTAIALLADPAFLAALSTVERFDPEAVEAVFASGLGGSGPDHVVARLEVVATLVAVASTERLTAGAARGIAVSAGSLLPLLAVHLDRRRPVEVAVPDGSGVATEVIRLGEYDELTNLFGQVLDDERAQLALGLGVGGFRIDQRASAISTIRARPELDSSGAIAHLTATLADATRVVELLVAARSHQDDLHAFRHGMARVQSSEMLSLLGAAVSWGVPPAVPMSRQLTTVGTRAIGLALAASTPRTVPVTGIETELALHFTVAVISVPVFDPTLRPVFGLGRVPDATWGAAAAVVDELDQETDPDERARHLSRLERLIADDPDLDTFLESVRATSGEDRQG